MENVKFDISIFGMDINGATDIHFQLKLAVIIFCFCFIIAAVFLDFLSGMRTARAIGEEIRSSGWRQSIRKLSTYLSLAFLCLMGDFLAGLFPIWKYPFFIMFACAVILFTEGRSMIENSRRAKESAGKLPENAIELMKILTSLQKFELMKRLFEEHEKKQKEKTE